MVPSVLIAVPLTVYDRCLPDPRCGGSHQGRAVADGVPLRREGDVRHVGLQGSRADKVAGYFLFTGSLPQHQPPAQAFRATRRQARITAS